MNKIITFLAAILLSTSLFAQVLQPVKWSFSQKNIDEETIELSFKATIDDGWYVYSQHIDGDGPIPTTFTFDDLGTATLDGSVAETGIKVKEGYDEMFDMNIKKFGGGVTFTQKVNITEATKIVGYLEFMTCNDEKCMPPEYVDFEFDLTNGDTGAIESETTDESAALNNEEIESSLGTINLSLNGNNVEEATILQPAKWSMTTKELNAEEIEIVISAAIQDGWYVYSQEIGEDGPIPTSFTFDENENIKINGLAREISEHIKEGYDEMFAMEIKKFAHHVDFIYTAKVTNREGILTGYLEYMTCNDEMCMPPEFVDFEIDLATLEKKIGEELYENEVTTTTTVIEGYERPVDIDNPIAVCDESLVQEKSSTIWGIFILGFLGGLVALLTPCVFPMIPLTVSFFTKGSKDKKKGLFNAIMYGFFILLVYILFSIPFHLLDTINPDILNEISTNIWLNIAFFAIFIFFAFSFFGFYEIQLPSGLANKASSAEGAGGMIGIFFMALTLAIVSFSCTGPILGSLLAGALSSDGGAWQLTAGMAGFGVALALPFTLFAAFPGMMNSLPKSGGWLNTVKVVLGFAELALAFKFLSNADLVKHWGLLKIEVFLGLWIVIFAGMALYLFGKIKFPHDSPIKKLSFPRIAFGVLVAAFVVYLASGFRYNEKAKTYHSLSLLSGLAPSTTYSWVYDVDCPQNFSCFHDYHEGLAYAKETGKPILVDFTGHACVNCRKVEETIWDKNEVHKLIDEEYVLISLYVDEKIDLPEEDQVKVFYNGRERTLRTVGNKWSYFQALNFKEVTQPQYVLLSPDEELLTAPIGYSGELTPEKYAGFLECGLTTYEEIK